LFSFKFAEYFEQYSTNFFQLIWGLVTSGAAASSKRNEKLIQEVVRYLGELVGYSAYNDFFKQNLIVLFSNIIIPNISVTQ
jgi:hypothetical protein